MLKQWIVVEHIHRSRARLQTVLQIRDHPLQPRFWKWIEEIEQDWFGGKSELGRVCADRFQREALLRLASVLAQIFLRSLMQCRQKFHAHDAAKGIVRRHQQRSSLARSQVDEDEIAKV